MRALTEYEMPRVGGGDNPGQGPYDPPEPEPCEFDGNLPYEPCGGELPGDPGNDGWYPGKDGDWR